MLPPTKGTTTMTTTTIQDRDTAITEIQLALVDYAGAPCSTTIDRIADGNGNVLAFVWITAVDVKGSTHGVEVRQVGEQMQFRPVDEHSSPIDGHGYVEDWAQAAGYAVAACETVRIRSLEAA